LVELFDNQQQTVPQSQHGAVKLPTQTSLNLTRQPSRSSSRIDDPARTDVIQEPNANCEDNSAAPTESSPLTMSSIYRSSPTAAPTSGNRIVRQEEPEHETLSDVDEDDDAGFQGGLISQLFHSKVQTRPSERVSKETSEGLSVGKQKLVGKLVRQREFLEHENNTAIDEYDDVRESNATQFIPQGKDRHVHDFNQRLLSQRQKQARDSNTSDSPFRSPSPDGDIPSIGSAHAKNLPGVVPNAFDRMRPMRTPKQTATITVGSKTTTSTIGSDALRYTHSPRSSRIRAKVWPATGSTATGFQSALRAFAAPGTQMSDASGNDDYDDEDDEEPVVRSTRASTWGKSPSEQRTQESRSETEHSPPQSVVLEDVEDEDDIGEQTKPQTEEEDSDEEYLDEESKKKMEDERVARLIAEAEQKASRPTDDGLKRTQNLLRGGHKDATTRLMQTIDVSLQGIKKQSAELRTAMQELGELHTTEGDDGETADAEERLSLTVSKADFARMHVAGQFNLGFIIAVRPDKNNEDELFIIDQHASDEKYNFERLQATTTVQHQRLVQPQILDLTAIEEELILDNQPALLRNGFVVTVDDSGESPVGRRCQLTSLPMSREVTFSSRDLEELLVLLADAKDARPSKVRKMFAMRACRSSVMVGKTLAARQMKRLVTNMGTIDKPWNCPHGRPTMRHLYGLGSWQSWEEGMGVAGLEREQGQGEVPWEAWLATQEEHSEDDSSHGQIQASAEL
jgi:DNA mismatch repair protein PMS2